MFQRRKNSTIFFFLLNIVAVTACNKTAESPPSPPPSAPKMPVKPAAIQKAVSTSVKPIADKTEHAKAMDFSNKRDPFKPFIVAAPAGKAAAPVRIGALPIHSYDVNQFKVIGIIAGLSENRAMVVDPAGKPYVLKEGMTIGRNEGKVIRISPASIEVMEKLTDESGKAYKNFVKLNLPRKQEFGR